MKPIARALDDATRQLTKTSDTARLDAELLMAEALHIDRDRLLLVAARPGGARALLEMVERRVGRRAGRLHHRASGLLEHRASRRPGRARPAAGFGSLDRLGDRAFRRVRGTQADPRSRHRSGNAAPRRARHLAGSYRPRHRCIAPCSVLCLGQCPPPRIRSASEADARQLGDGDARDVRPHPVQSALHC